MNEDKKQSLWRKLIFLPAAALGFYIVLLAVSSIYDRLIPPGTLVSFKTIILRYGLNELALAAFAAYCIGIKIWYHKVCDIILLVLLGLIVIFLSFIIAMNSTEPYAFILYTVTSCFGLFLSRLFFYKKRTYQSLISGDYDESDEE